MKKFGSKQWSCIKVEEICGSMMYIYIGAWSVAEREGVRGSKGLHIVTSKS